MGLDEVRKVRHDSIVVLRNKDVGIFWGFLDAGIIWLDDIHFVLKGGKRRRPYSTISTNENGRGCHTLKAYVLKNL